MVYIMEPLKKEKKVTPIKLKNPIPVKGFEPFSKWVQKDKDKKKKKKKKVIFQFSKVYDTNKIKPQSKLYYLRKFKLNKTTNFIKNHRSYLLHTIITKSMYKAFEGHQFFAAHEMNYNDFVYDKFYFKRFKEYFLEFAKILRYRYNFKHSHKSSFFKSAEANFSVNPYNRYRWYDKLLNYYNKLITPIGNRKAPQVYTSRIINPILIYHFKGLLSFDPATFSNDYSYKWGRLTVPTYKAAKSSRHWNTFKYNYLFFNISVLRYLQLKNYSNKLIEYSNKILNSESLSDTLRHKLFGFIKSNATNLISKTDNLNQYIIQSKRKLDNFFENKANVIQDNKRAMFVLKRLRFFNLRHLYMSHLRYMLIRYFRVNLHIKFTKTNIFITVTDFKGNARYRHSIGLIGYKKDQKKTYYAAKELIKDAIPRLFRVFKIKNSAILSSFSFVQTDLMKLFLDLLSSNKKNYEYLEKYWDYPSTIKAELTESFRKIIIHTMKKYITLRIILRGSKSKLKGLMRKIFKELKQYKLENSKQLVRVLFLALNTKPHNGCRSPKKGRRRTKRRRQRLRFKLLDRQYEFQQRMRRKDLFWRRKFIRMYRMKVPKYVTKHPLRRSKNNSLLSEKRYETVSNIQNNIKSSKKYYFMYARPRSRKLTKAQLHYLTKYPRKYRIWRDHERWTNPLAMEPNKVLLPKIGRLKRSPQFYRIK